MSDNKSIELSSNDDWTKVEGAQCAHCHESDVELEDKDTPRGIILTCSNCTNLTQFVFASYEPGDSEGYIKPL